MAEQRSPRGAAPRTVALSQVPTAAPGLRFAVWFPGAAVEGPGGVRRDADVRRGADVRRDAGVGHGAEHGAEHETEHEAGEPHPLAGTGKLFLALTVARLAARDPELLATPLTVRAGHRAVARTGTLRQMSGELELTVDDAMALVIGTGDGACAAALLEHLARRGVDVLAEARDLTAALGLDATALTGLESTELETTTPDTGAPETETGANATEGAGVTEDASGAHRTERTNDTDVPAASWGEGLVGTTMPGDLCTLLCRLVAAASPGVVFPAGRHDTAGAGAEDGREDGADGEGRRRGGATTPGAAGGAAIAEAGDPLGAEVADRVLGWMGTVFEPAGLASALPGVGPRTLPHRTVTGLELRTPPGNGGWASVLILPADVGRGRPTACVAAYQPPAHPGEAGRRAAVHPLEASAALGTLGLAVSGARG